MRAGGATRAMQNHDRRPRGNTVWLDEQSGDREIPTFEGDLFGLAAPGNVVEEREAHQPQSQDKKAGSDYSKATQPLPTHVALPGT